MRRLCHSCPSRTCIWRSIPSSRCGAINFPGVEFGPLTAAEVNYASSLLSNLAAQTGQHKILIVHQFVASMLPDKGAIDTRPTGVDVAIVMDGWGGQGIKIEHYDMHVRDSDFPYGGIKLFFDQNPA